MLILWKENATDSPSNKKKVKMNLYVICVVSDSLCCFEAGALER